MGFRFRKSISLGSFLRLNLSKSGVSVGVGPKGLNVNVGPRGVRKTIGLPGTGLYYQETSSWPQSTDAPQPTGSGAQTNSAAGWIVLAIVILIIVFAVNLGRGSSQNAPTNAPKVETRTIQPLATPSVRDRSLSGDEVRELQTMLRKQGFDAGAPDGVVGPKTRAASQAFSRAHRINAQDDPSLSLLEAVRGARK